MEYLAYILIGAAVAAFGTLIGAGGGIIFVPLFMFWFGWPPTLIIGTSLFIVFLNALSGTIAYMKQGRIRYDAAWLFAAATVPGAIGGALMSDYFTGSGFRLSFGILLTLIALLILWKNISRTEIIESERLDFDYPKTTGIVTSFIIGFLSSIFGIGGGVIHVPVMIYLLRFPTHIATATSHFVLSISAGVGVLTHALAGHILWQYGLLFGIGAVIGAQIGAWLAKRVQAKAILILLAIALLSLGLRLTFLQ